MRAWESIAAGKHTLLAAPTGSGKTLAAFLTAINALLEEEFLCWPVPVHDDMADAISRIFDLDLGWPRAAEEGERPDRYRKQRTGTWMSI